MLSPAPEALFDQVDPESERARHYGDRAAPVRFSIVILTYARDAVLSDLLASLAGHLKDRRDYELILVDNNADDVDRGALLGAAFSATWLPLSANRGVSARNVGMAVARGEFIIVVDDDCFVQTPDFLDRFADLFATDPTIGAVTIRKLIGETMEARRDIIPHTRKGVDLNRRFLTFRIVGGCVAFRRDVFQRIGGFSPEIFYGIEEIELSYRIIDSGWKILYTPEIVAIELEHPSGRRPNREVFTQRLTNKYIISFLHMPFPQILLNYALFTPYTFFFYRGDISVPKAIANFVKWLGRSDRPRRRPIGRATVAYIKACGGSIWR